MAQAATIEYQGAVLILQALGIAPTAVNVNLLVAQEINEWGWSGADLAQNNNPLATTQWTPQATGKWNSIPVWIFSSLQAGAAACAETLRDYPTMLQALQTSNAGLYFGSAGRAELYEWSGHSTSYANDLQQYYGQLGTPPNVALASGGGRSGGVGVGTSGTSTDYTPVAASSSLAWWALGIGAVVLAGGLYLVRHS